MLGMKEKHLNKLGVLEICNEMFHHSIITVCFRHKDKTFTSKYKLYLPTEEELLAEIEIQKSIFQLQQEEKS